MIKEAKKIFPAANQSNLNGKTKQKIFHSPVFGAWLTNDFLFGTNLCFDRFLYLWRFGDIDIYISKIIKNY